MDYLWVSDCLWYVGHILTGISGLVGTHSYTIAVGLVLFGQCITIVSRPIGRIKDHTTIEEVESTPEIVYL
jgi:hypothetical protein